MLRCSLQSLPARRGCRRVNALKYLLWVTAGGCRPSGTPFAERWAGADPFSPRGGDACRAPRGAGPPPGPHLPRPPPDEAGRRNVGRRRAAAARSVEMGMALTHKKTAGPMGAVVVPFLPGARKRGYKIRLDRLIGEGAQAVLRSCGSLERQLAVTITALEGFGESLAESQRIIDGAYIRALRTQGILDRGDLEEMIAARDSLRIALCGEGGPDVVATERERSFVSASDTAEGA